MCSLYYLFLELYVEGYAFSAKNPGEGYAFSARITAGGVCVFSEDNFPNSTGIMWKSTLTRGRFHREYPA